MLTGLLSDTLSRTGVVVLVAVMIVAAAAVAILIILLRAKTKGEQANCGAEATYGEETTVRLTPESGEKPAGMSHAGTEFAVECEITYIHTDERIL